MVTLMFSDVNNSNQSSSESEQYAMTSIFVMRDDFIAVLGLASLSYAYRTPPPPHHSPPA
jgi:hypothetical protein